MGKGRRASDVVVEWHGHIDTTSHITLKMCQNVQLESRLDVIWVDSIPTHPHVPARTYREHVIRMGV